MSSEDLMAKYEHIFMAASSVETDGRVMVPNQNNQGDMDYLANEGYFKHVNIAPDMSGYALTNKGREEAWRAWERHKDLRDVLSKL